MIPFGNRTVTMLHKAEKGYERHVLNGCSWRTSNEKALSIDAVICTERTSCRIPPKYPQPFPGDLMILGKTEAEAHNEIELVRLMESLRKQGFRTFRVQSCADNTDVPMPHYAATGV